MQPAEPKAYAVVVERFLLWRARRSALPVRKDRLQPLGYETRGEETLADAIDAANLYRRTVSLGPVQIAERLCSNATHQ